MTPPKKTEPCRRVLIVDDVRSARLVMQRSLDEFRIDSLAVSSAAEALRVFLTEPIAVLLTDYRMPDIDGVELMELVAHSHPLTQLLMVTGIESEPAVQRVLELGGHFLIKPVPRYDLAQAVLAALERYAAEQRDQQGNGGNGHG